MPLSRLENFLKNVDGNVLYVNPTDLDATDSIENQGNSLTRPFKTIQRALLEASRFSYQVGQNNDKFDRTTIMLYPGTHEIDNRPGFNVVNSSGNASFRDRLGNSQTLTQLTEESNYNLEDPTNELYKYNSVEGGVIVPRGVSLAGYDVRKTKIRPKFVPDPTDLSVTRAAIFRLTGACHFYAVTFFDGDPQGSVYKNYSTNRFSPQFSHHKLTCFEYADGVNGVGVGTSSVTTDLQMYFHKIQQAFGDSSGRAIGDFPSTTDMQPALPEFEIVGPVKAEDVGITSIRAGTGGTPDQVITVQTSGKHGLVVDSPIRVAGVNTYPDIYNGNFVVSSVTNDEQFSFLASATPADGLPALDGDEVVVADTDNVQGASPYIFHCSMRSAYGMCGLHADGSKASGFKSMLVSQFTGIGLQKDNNAFLVYNKTSGQYDTNETASDSEKPLYLNGNAIYRPSYKNAHIKTSNDGYIQAVSIFAVGFSEHFTTSEGGDMSITNSNSNFGAVALNAKGFKPAAFAKDNRGYITHIIPPENQFKQDISVEWEAINVTKTVAAGSSNPSKIYLDGFSDSSTPPVHVIAGYRVGAKSDELLHVSIAGVGTVTTPVRMLNPDGSEGDISIKEYEVKRTGIINDITSSVITLRTDHKLHAGESIRVLSDSGYLPDGIDSNVIYFAITDDSTAESLNDNQIKLARSKNDALVGGSGNFITINNNKGGVLKIQSRVSDKKPGDLAHPIQYDSGNWYIKASNTNTLFTQVAAASTIVGERTGKTFIKRKEDTRSLNDKIYRLRYVIPKESLDARPPIPGYTLQESNTVGVVGASEFTNNIPDVTAQRNLRILKSIDRSSNTGITTVVTEKPHNLIKGDQVQLRNVKSGANSNGTLNSGYNIVTDVVGITSSKGFELKFVDTDPGTYTAHTARDNNLPVVARWKHKDTFTVYRSETVKAHDYQRQDGVYHLICVDSSISPTVNEFDFNKFNQNITDLYPQFDADNFTMDPAHAASFAINEPIGKVVTNDLRNSVTKEFTNNFIVGHRVGFAVTFAEGHTNTGIATIYTGNVQHNLNTITSITLAAGGSGYGSNVTLYNVHLTGGSGHGATGNATVNGSGQVTAVEIIDGGSGYTKGNTLSLRAGGNNAQVTVATINNNIGDAIQIIGVGSTEDRYNSGYNGIHTITSVTPTSVSYDSGYNANVGVHSVTTAGIHTGFFMLAGNAPNINSIVYDDKSVGIVTVTTDEPHGLSVNNSFKIVGAAQTIYNGEHIVFEKNNTTQFSFKFVDPFTPATYTTSGGKAQVLPIMYGAKGGVIQEGSERLDQRQIPLTVGIHTTLNNSVLAATNAQLTLSNSAGFNKGDYIQIDEEIIRVSSNFSNNVATVLRGQLGSRADSHAAGSVAKKIRILAVEKRRASVLRASGHTFEYLGFGPGNYSTAFPEKQSKILTREAKFLAQSTIDNGGSVVYTGVNDAGDFHIGNKVVNSQDGTEATFNIPVPTTTGSASADSDATSGRLDVIFDSAFVREGMVVDGNNNTTVRINAPTTVTEKLTVTSTNGAEFHSIDLTGGLSPARTITYSSETPTGSGTVGDIVYTSDPLAGGYLGWVFTPSGWKRFGLVSIERDLDTWVIGDQNNNGKLGIGTALADRAGVNASFRGGLDVRGQIVADKLLMTGISTFQGTTIFEDVEIDRLKATGSLDVTGVSTFSKQVIVGAGITVNEFSATGISSFHGQGSRVYIQHKASTTAAASAVNTGSGIDKITITAHGYTTNDKVKYISGSTAIGGLVDHTIYRVIKVDDNSFQLRTGMSGAAIDLTSQGAGTHTFQTVDGNRFDSSAASRAGHAAQLQVDMLSVVGVATFPSSIDFTNTTVAGLSTVSGNVDFKSDLNVDGTVNVGGVTNLTGTLNTNGDTNLGNATSDTITATGRFDSHLIPATDSLYDLGSSTLEWSNLFLDGTAHIDTLDVDANAGIIGNLTVGGNFSVNGVVDLGNAASDTISVIGRFDTSLLPSTDSTRDLGASTMEWRNLFIDGTAHIDTLDVDENAGIIGNLTVTGTSEFNDTVDVDADFAVRNGTTDKFFVDNVTGNTNIEGTLTADGHVELNSTLNADGNTTLGGTLSVTSNTSLLATLSVNGNTTLGNQSSDSVTIPGFLDVNGYAEFDNIRINGNTISAQDADGSVNINGNGSGDINLNDDVDVAGTLDVAGVFNANSTSNFAGDATFNGGAAAVNIGANSDIRLANGTWTGEACKIQHHSNYLYLQGGTNGHVFRRSSGQDAVYIAANGTLQALNTVTIAGLLDANGGAHIDNLRFGINDDSEISTSAGDLRLDSAGGTVQVNDNLSVSGTITGNGSGLTTLNAGRLTDGTVPQARLGSSGTRDGNHFLAGDNTFKQVTVAINSITNSGSNRVLVDNGNATATAESNVTFDNVTFHVHGGSRQIVCDGNIVAFNSDIRLKTAIQPIENAVAKTLKLNGFTYEHNEVAESIGYKLDGERFAGVSAQDVQSVLPEAVKPAPADPNYLTVQYEKIVPLLIEAIKELKAEIDELKK